MEILVFKTGVGFWQVERKNISDRNVMRKHSGRNVRIYLGKKERQ